MAAVTFIEIKGYTKVHLHPEHKVYITQGQLSQERHAGAIKIHKS